MRPSGKGLSNDSIELNGLHKVDFYRVLPSRVSAAKCKLTLVAADRFNRKRKT
jgi:hypothetical protein